MNAAKNEKHAAIDRKVTPGQAPAANKPAHLTDALWGSRTKDHRKRLLDVCALTLARSNCPAAVKKVAESVQNLLMPSTGIFFTFRGDVGNVFKRLAIPEDMVTANDLLDEISALYKKSIATIDPQELAEARQSIESSPGRKKVFVLPESLDELQLENRQVHMVANTLSNVSAYIAVSPSSKLRETAVALQFLASTLEELAPYRVKTPINTCILCHRHDFDRHICRSHIDEDGRHLSSINQRKLVEDSLAISEKKLAAKLSANLGLIRSIVSKEEDASLMMADIQSGFDALFPNSDIANVGRIWNEVVADYARRCAESQMQPEPVKVDALAWCWYEHPEIQDAYGFARMEQPLSSMLLKMFNDIMRYESYIDAGGEVVRKRRKIITDTEDIRKIGILRQVNRASMREIGESLNISTSQVKRILMELGLD